MGWWAGPGRHAFAARTSSPTRRTARDPGEKGVCAATDAASVVARRERIIAIVGSQEWWCKMGGRKGGSCGGTYPMAPGQPGPSTLARLKGSFVHILAWKMVRPWYPCASFSACCLACAPSLLLIAARFQGRQGSGGAAPAPGSPSSHCPRVVGGASPHWRAPLLSPPPIHAAVLLPPCSRPACGRRGTSAASSPWATAAWESTASIPAAVVTRVANTTTVRCLTNSACAIAARLGAECSWRRE